MMETEQPKLLIVDDQQANIQVLYNILKPDYQLFFATSGVEALQQAGQLRPDLILLDVMMPEMDGLEVCRRLQADSATATIPVIFVTAMESDDEEVRGLEVGAVDYVTKPIRPEIVKARVRTHVKLKKQSEEFARLADLDGLTGIANRRAFDRQLRGEIYRALRTRMPLGVLMVDVDHFKRYNDHYGHLAGDDCLRQVAHCLEKTLSRETDLVARYGGEEFSCILFNTDLAGAEVIGERLRQAILDLQLEHCQSSTAEVVSISVGGCSLIPDAETGLEDLLNCADRQLYRAKKAGRNCACFGAGKEC